MGEISSQYRYMNEPEMKLPTQRSAILHNIAGQGLPLWEMLYLADFSPHIPFQAYHLMIFSQMTTGSFFLNMTLNL